MNPESINIFYRVKALLNISGVGIIRLLSLVEKFGTLEALFNSTKKELISVGKISEKLADKIDSVISNFPLYKKESEKELEKLNDLGGKIITYWDNNYPQQLKNIYYPPLILYLAGKYTAQDSQSVSIVGTRRLTDYGKTVANKFASELAKQGITIISGMARGIDSVAHKAALKHGGRTIAVIGSGLDIIYPPENKNLFNSIIENGAVISEFPLGTKPDAQNFPKRNRIIAGLSLGTLVIETKENGGAMQTAKFAFDQNKEVFAVPGNITSEKSNGTNLLIQRNEAKLILSTEDILLELQLKLKPTIGVNIPKQDLDLTLFEEKIYNALDTIPKQVDTIASQTSLSIPETLINLLSLEFKGIVQQLPGKMFKKA